MNLLSQITETVFDALAGFDILSAAGISSCDLDWKDYQCLLDDLWAHIFGCLSAVIINYYINLNKERGEDK